MNISLVVFFSIFAGLKINHQSMKSNRFIHLLSCAAIALVFSLIAIGCHNSDKNMEAISVTRNFANSNWTFEEQVMDMPFTITDTTKDYSIEFVLNYDTARIEVEQLPVTVTLRFPDGQETYVTSLFDFNQDVNKSFVATGNGNTCNMNLVAFPRKSLSQSGEYHVIFYRKAEKYDNYGFHSLTMKVIPLKKNKN